jgi:hypothetical protein
MSKCHQNLANNSRLKHNQNLNTLHDNFNDQLTWTRIENLNKNLNNLANQYFKKFLFMYVLVKTSQKCPFD